MRNAAKLGLAALTVCLLLSAAVSTASARSISSSSQTFRVTWSRLEWEGSVGAAVRCQVTIEGSFHSRSFTKVVGSLIGQVSRATVKTESCTNGRATYSLPVVNVTFEFFTGTLPSMSSVGLLLRLRLVEIDRPFGLTPNCTYGTATNRTTYSLALSAGAATNLTPVSGNSLSLREARNEEFFGRCPAAIEERGGATDGVTTVLNSSSRITITLI